MSQMDRLLALFQDKLVEAINDPRHFPGERAGLRIASVLFRACLKDLGIANVLPKPKS